MTTEKKPSETTSTGYGSTGYSSTGYSSTGYSSTGYTGTEYSKPEDKSVPNPKQEIPLFIHDASGKRTITDAFLILSQRDWQRICNTKHVVGY